MKTLYYVPIIHTSADLGSIASEVTKRGIAGFGEEFWKKHNETIAGFWDSIEKYFTYLEVRNFKIYQDALVADGETGQMIIEEGAKAGSKNYGIIKDLTERGAALVKTEDFSLVKKERDRIVKITKAETIAAKLLGFFIYRLTKDSLLKKRDNYVAKRIGETLDHGERGILFMGAEHEIIPKLSRKIQIVEIKEAKKVRDYQRLLLRHSRGEKKFAELAGYLVSEIK